MDDIRRQIHNEDVMNSLKSPLEEIKRVADDLGPAANLPPEKNSDDNQELS